MTGLVYTPGVIVETEVLPDDLMEEDISFYADEKYPLDGKITTPKEGEVLAGIVLVHGSGPNDMDETIGVNKPFSDLAYGLASKGFAVLRYDKRTLTHGTEMTKSEDYKYLTIDEETAYDAAAAVEFLSKNLAMIKNIPAWALYGGNACILHRQQDRQCRWLICLWRARLRNFGNLL